MRRALFATLIAVVVSLPLAGSRVPGVGLRIGLVAMLVPAAMAALYVIRERLWDFASPALVAAGLLTLSTIVSLPIASDSHATDLTVATVAGFGIVAAIVAVCGSAQIAVILEVLSLVAGVIAALSLSDIGSLTSQLGGSVVSGRLQGLFSQPNELGGFCALTLPIAIIAARYAHSTLRRLALTVSALTITGALALSLSRGAFLGAFVGLVMIVVLLPDARKAMTRIVLAVVVAAVAAAALLPQSDAVLGILTTRLQSITSGAAAPYDERPQIWAEALRLADRHPLLGIGPGEYQTKTLTPGSRLYANPVEHAHNLVLTVLAEQGFIGVVALVAMGAALVLTAARLMTRSRNLSGPTATTIRWTTAAPLAALAATAAHGLIDMPLRNPILNVAVWIVFGCAAAGPLARRMNSTTTPTATEPEREPARKEVQS
ncbi:MAG: O-antigen ligase family protein [Actinomycetota bacterium]|nr:O-antigen ligase family protein [Actinomycetota bacterium]